MNSLSLDDLLDSDEDELLSYEPELPFDDSLLDELQEVPNF